MQFFVSFLRHSKRSFTGGRLAIATIAMNFPNKINKATEHPYLRGPNVFTAESKFLID